MGWLLLLKKRRSVAEKHAGAGVLGDEGNGGGSDGGCTQPGAIRPERAGRGVLASVRAERQGQDHDSAALGTSGRADFHRRSIRCADAGRSRPDGGDPGPRAARLATWAQSRLSHADTWLVSK